MYSADTKHTIGFRDTKLKPGEVIVGHLDGWHGEQAQITTSGHGAGAIILTGSRIVFFRRGAFSDSFFELPLHLIIQVETRLVHGHRRFHLHTADGLEVFKTFNEDRAFGHFVSEIEEHRMGRKLAA